MWTDQAIQDTIRCTEDPIYFLETFCWLDGDEGVVPFNIGLLKDDDFFYQREIIEQLLSDKNVVILKSRRVGLSWIAAFYALWGILFNRGWNALFVSRTEKEAVSLLKKVKFMYNNLAYKDSTEIGLATPANFLKSKVTIDNQREFSVGQSGEDGQINTTSSVISFTTTKHSGRGEKAKFVFVDEVQFIENQEEIFASILTTAARAGIWMMGSNSGQVGTAFHKLCMAGKAKENKHYYYREVWPWEAGMDAEFIEKASEALTEDLKRQEWYLEFMQPGNAVFDMTHLAACYKPLDMYPELKTQLEDYRKKVEKDRYQYHYYTGVDSAVGKVHRKSKEKDNSVFTALTLDGVQAFTFAAKVPLSTWAGQNVEESGKTISAPGKVSELHALWPGTCNIEENGPGYAVIDRHQVPQDGVSDLRPFHTNKHTKSRLIKNLIIAVESHSIVITDPKTYEELSMYQYGDIPDSYEAPVGQTDDRVVAVALAWDLLVREGGFEFNYGTSSPDELPLGEYEDHYKLLKDLDAASIAPMIEWDAPIRASYMLPKPFDEIPEPADVRYLPDKSILDLMRKK